MKRKAVFLAASVTEVARFAMIAFVAFDAGIAAGGAAGDVFRYAAAAQLLFAIGFFFLWLDRPRYGRYSPLLIAGKALNLAAAAAAALEGLLLERPTLFAVGEWPLGPLTACSAVAVDLFGLAVLLSARASPGADALGDEDASGEDEIERVEA
jgi:hypothetical protein